MADEHVGQVFDMSKNEWIDDPTTKDTVVVDPPKDDPDPNADPDQTNPKPEGDPEPKPGGDDSGTSPNADPKKDDDPDPKQDDPVAPTDEQFNTYLKDTLSEKYGIESKDDLIEVLTENEELVKELETEKKKEPAFKSEQEKKLFNFLTQYDESQWGEGMQTAAQLINLNVEKADGKKVMQEAFVLKKPHLTREKAIDLFEDDYESKFAINDDEFEEKEVLKKKKKLRDIKLEDAEADARKFVSEEKEKMKAKPKEPEKEAVKVPEAAIKGYASTVEKFFTDKGGFESIIYPIGKEGKQEIKIVFPKEKVKELREHMNAYVRRGDVYDKSGKIPNFDPLELAQQVAHLLWTEDGIPWITARVLEQVDTVAQVKKVEDIGKIKPTKTSISQGDTDFKNMDPEHQMRILGERMSKART